MPVKKENALAYVPGSHRPSKIFHQYNFGLFNPDGLTGIDQVDFSAVADAPVPDIDADPEGFGVTSWDMQPGDCVAFNSRIMHGGSGKLADDQGLRVFTTKWLGDNVHIKFREHGMDPDHSAIMTEHGLKPGDRPGTDLYPQICGKRIIFHAGLLMQIRKLVLISMLSLASSTSHSAVFDINSPAYISCVTDETVELIKIGEYEGDNQADK